MAHRPSPSVNTSVNTDDEASNFPELPTRWSSNAHNLPLENVPKNISAGDRDYDTQEMVHYLTVFYYVTKIDTLVEKRNNYLHLINGGFTFLLSKQPVKYNSNLTKLLIYTNDTKNYAASLNVRIAGS